MVNADPRVSDKELAQINAVSVCACGVPATLTLTHTNRPPRSGNMVSTREWVGAALVVGR